MKHKFNVGDKVRILEHTHSHTDKYIGQVCKIIKVENGDGRGLHTVFFTKFHNIPLPTLYLKGIPFLENEIELFKPTTLKDILVAENKLEWL